MCEEKTIKYFISRNIVKIAKNARFLRTLLYLRFFIKYRRERAPIQVTDLSSFLLKNLKLKVQISSCNSFSRNVLQTYFKWILELPWNLKHLKGFKNWPCRFWVSLRYDNILVINEDIYVTHPWKKIKS